MTSYRDAWAYWSRMFCSTNSVFSLRFSSAGEGQFLTGTLLKQLIQFEQTFKKLQAVRTVCYYCLRRKILPVTALILLYTLLWATIIIPCWLVYKSNLCVSQPLLKALDTQYIVAVTTVPKMPIPQKFDAWMLTVFTRVLQPKNRSKKSPATYTRVKNWYKRKVQDKFFV